MTSTTATATRTDKLEAAHAALTAALEALVSGDDWQAFLTTASRFRTYSVSNQLLIWCQRPDATRVAGFNTWKSLGRMVRKGEKALRILAPMTRKDDDGETMVFGFKPVCVFDVDQTDGEPLAELPDAVLVEGDRVDHLWHSLVAQVQAAGCQVVDDDALLPDGANGVTAWDRRVVAVRSTLPGAQSCKTLAHELAHVLLHAPDDVSRPARPAVCEVEAESVAALVCSAHGLDSAGYSLPYVAAWSGGDVEAVKATAGRVVACARAVLDAID